MNAHTMIANARAAGFNALPEPDAKKLLAERGVQVPRCVAVAADAQELSAAAALKGPYALKVISKYALHKSDVGGVRLGLGDLDAAKRSMVEMRERLASNGFDVQGFLIEEMVKPGHEVVVGGKIHPQFGPIIMVGLGGVFVEALGDVAFRLCPIDASDAEAMLDEIRGSKVLKGARGGVTANTDAIIDVLLKVGGENGLLLEFADCISELDINPLIVDSIGATAVDARLILPCSSR